MMLVRQEAFGPVLVRQPVAECLRIGRRHDHDVKDLLLAFALIRNDPAFKRTTGGLDEFVKVTDLHGTKRSMTRLAGHKWKAEAVDPAFSWLRQL